MVGQGNFGRSFVEEGKVGKIVVVVRCDVEGAGRTAER